MRIFAPSFQFGFTLIELSIVLLIIGLIVGGVLIGQDLIRASQIRTIISEVESYNTAVMTFRTKYNGLPGDLGNAQTFWGADPGGCPNTPPNIIPKTATCNGNADGMISKYDDVAPDWSQRYESHRFWQHLANADLIPGTYTGAVGTVGGFLSTQAGVNAPMSKAMTNGSYKMVFYISNPVAHPGLFHEYYYHTFVYGLYNPTTQDLDPILTPLSMQSLDEKIDDGIPGTGLVSSHNPNWAPSANCTTSINPVTSRYNAAYSAPACLAIMKASY
jgi:prepilin-type N-terminal cleavage/methylation domain-containing protein